MSPFSTLCQRLKENDPCMNKLVKCYGLNEHAVETLSESLIENTVAEQLHLINIQTLGKDGSHKLAHLLEHNETLQELYICTSLDDSITTAVYGEGLEKHDQALSHRQKIQKLDEAHYASNLIFAGLAQSTSIQNLYLSDKNIGNDGAKAIGSMLKVNNSIKDISLAHNNISNPGIEYICAGLMENSSVETLDLSGNRFSRGGAIAICNMLQNNSNLKEIRMAIDRVHIGREETNNILLRAAEHNFFVHKYYVDDSVLNKELFFWGELNLTYHREILRKDDLPDGLWSYILSRCTRKKWRYSPSKSPFTKKDVLFYFVKSKPELFIRKRNQYYHEKEGS